jgi:predicted HicB family RNase H-like nuclease
MPEANFASLNPALLARKGGAKPAMRPQLGRVANEQQPTDEQLEDLGWNDMGGDPAPADPAEIVPLSKDAEPANTSEPSPAREQQAKIAKRLDAKPASSDNKKVGKAKKSKKAKQKQRRSATSQGKRAAFTLRLDPARHLKLRLAATMQNRSAQQFVTDALDDALAKIEELEALAAKIKQP